MAWSVDTNTNIYTIDTNDVTSDIFVKDGNSYTTFSNILTNYDQDFVDNVELYIVDKLSNENLLPWNGSVTVTSSDEFSYKLVNTLGSSFTVPVFDQFGKPMILRITYN